MMAAARSRSCQGAISKTVNMPRDTTPADVADAYLEGWRMGLKALAIYRDGSKESQPLNTGTEADKAAAKVVATPRRERLPDTRNSITHKFSIAGHEGYITVGLYEDGRPGEMFITMAKEGSTIGGLMDCFGTAVSMCWQYGVPLEVYVNKFSHTRFEPMGHTKNPDIRIAKSLVDYIFRWLAIRFLPGYREANKGLFTAADDAAAKSGSTLAAEETASEMRSAAKKQAFASHAGRGEEVDGRGGAERSGIDAICHVDGQRYTSRTQAGCRSVGPLRRVDEHRPPRRTDGSQRTVRQLPARRSKLRQLRRHHRPQRQLLAPSPQSVAAAWYAAR